MADPAPRRRLGICPSVPIVKRENRARPQFAAVRFFLLAVALPMLSLVAAALFLFRHAFAPASSHVGAAPKLPPLSAFGFKSVQAAHYPPFTIFVYNPPRRDIVSASLAATGAWDQPGTALLVATLAVLRGTAPGVVDFGANLGWFSFVAASHGAHVTAVEALPDNVRAIRLGLAANSRTLNSSKMRLVEAALVGEADQSNLPIASRVCLDQVVRKETNFGNGLLPLSGEIASCAQWATALTLDQVLERGEPLAFLKADCEGCEAGALFGARRTLTGPGAPCVILMEWFPRVIRFVDANSRNHISGMVDVLIAGFYDLYSMSGLQLQGPVPHDQLLRHFSNHGIQSAVLLQGSERCFPPMSPKRHGFIRKLATRRPNSN